MKEFVIALVVVGLLTGALAAALSSPDRKAVTLSNWAKAAPDDVVATATAELAGTSTSAGYGPPYNNAAVGQQIFGLSTAEMGRSHDPGRQRQRPGDQPAAHRAERAEARLSAEGVGSGLGRPADEMGRRLFRRDRSRPRQRRGEGQAGRLRTGPASLRRAS